MFGACVWGLVRGALPLRGSRICSKCVSCNSSVLHQESTKSKLTHINVLFITMGPNLGQSLVKGTFSDP